MTDSLLHQIALTLLPQVGPVTAKLLVSYCGSAENVFRASRRELLRIPGIGPAVADNLRTAVPLLQAEKELVFLEKHEVAALFYTDNRYPARLRQIADGPALVYFKGSDTALLGAERIVAIVGTRQPTEYGRMACEELVNGLKTYGAVVVSGLAYGIDIAAHRQATAQGIANIGVLGHGLGSIYPSHHRPVALKMIEHGGLLSEYVHDAKPDRDHFPMRNRIIAGLCDALVVVETATSGGSMISAEFAVQYAREVFAFPGRVTDPKSAGCHLLLKTERARLLENAADLAAVMGWAEAGRESARQLVLPLDLDPAETLLVDLIRRQPEIAVDELAQAAGLPPGELAAAVLALEFKGVVRTLPGKRYVLTG
ncbi:MAG: DNA-protecting protein DprA [Saprospiraceae bacterium]|nr:DNA-protecting protein DprA [Saprospiraceae bacterium]